MPQAQEKNPRPQSAQAPLPETTASVLNAQFGDVCGNIKAGLEAQKQMMDVFHDVSHAWFARAASQTELAFKLPARLSAAHTIPDAVSVYQQWLNEWVDVIDEDNRRLLSDSKKFVDQGVHYFTMPSPGATT